MKSRITIAAIVLLSLAAVGQAPAATDQPRSPSWTLADAAGNEVSFPEENQPTTILLFWATWCPYCRSLMPHLQSILDEHGDGIRVLAVNVFEDDDPVAYMKERGYQFTLLPEGDEVAAEYGVRGTPGLFLVDSEGRIAWQLSDVPPPAERLTGIDENWQKASRLAPLWAAELRQAIDRMDASVAGD